MRAYIEIDGKEYPIRSVTWYKERKEISDIVFYLNDKLIMIYNNYFDGTRLFEENLQDISNGETIHADLEKLVVWR